MATTVLLRPARLCRTIPPPPTSPACPTLSRRLISSSSSSRRPSNSSFTFTCARSALTSGSRRSLATLASDSHSHSLDSTSKGTMSASPTPAALPELRIAIVGAGMGGLAAAASLASHGFKNVSVYEAAPQFGEVGAGLNCGPNINRILERWGVWDIVKSEGVVLDGTRVVGASSHRPRPVSVRLTPVTQTRAATTCSPMSISPLSTSAMATLTWCVSSAAGL